MIGFGIQLLFYFAVAVVVCIESKVLIKLNKITGGYSKLKPRWIHIRNNLQGNVRIVDHHDLSIEVNIQGINDFVEKDVAVHYQVAKKDTILDIQVYHRTLRLAKDVSSNSFATADVLLKSPGYLILPGSKVFHRTNSSGKTLLADWSGYKASIEEYEIEPINRIVDVSRPCYSTCRKTCDLVNGICIPCKRGFQHNPSKSSWNLIDCQDIDECKLGKHSCSGSTSCENTIGSYKCTCAKGFYTHKMTCKACKSCPTGQYEFMPCSATNDAVCKKYSPPCKNYMYESHPYGVSYDRYCQDVLRVLKPINRATMLKPVGSLNGSWMKPFTGFGKHIITDNLLRNSSISSTVVFLNNSNREITILKSKLLQLDLKLESVNAIPIFVDSDTSMMYGSDKLSGLAEVRRSFCRNPAPDAFVLKHRLLNDYKTQIGRFICSKVEEGLCPDDVVTGDHYYERISKSCGHDTRSVFNPSKLYCGSYVHLAALFGISKAKFKEGPIVSLNDEGCRYLYEACINCKDETCSGDDDSEPCRKQCKYICMQYRAKRCAVQPKSCSRGDVIEWSIKPEFYAKDLRNGFNCYLKRKIPARIFQLKYRVRVPNSTVQSDWFRVTAPQLVKGQNIQFGMFHAEYENTTVLPDSIILRGGNSSNLESNQYGFKVLLLKDISQQNVFEFRKEFKFMLSKPSLLNLQRWQDVSNCRVLANWKKYLKQPELTAINVKVERLRNIGTRFAYRISKAFSPTKIRLSVVKGVSVLKKLAKTSFITSLNSTLGGNYMYWRIDVTGNVTDCPGYLQLSIIEKTRMLLVLKQDILVLCPQKYFHVVAVIPKDKFHPFYKARMFIAYAFDGAHMYESHMEKRREMKIKAFIFKSKTQANKHSVLTDLRVMAKFDAISILTGVFVAGLIAIMVFSCLFKPKRLKQLRKKGRALLQQRRNNNAENKAQEDGDKLECRHMLPIVFLVAVRVAYSFLLTISFITIIFNAVNKADLEVLNEFSSFFKVKINQSNQIALALDQFRESEIKVMTDKAAFLECACDYHIGRIMRNMRDNMTAFVQLHDLLVFDKVSDILVQAMMNKFEVLRTADRKVKEYQAKVRSIVAKVEDRVVQYSRRVYLNKHFKDYRSVFPWTSVVSAIKFLGFIRVLDTRAYYNTIGSILGQINAATSQLSLANVIGRLKKPLYPLVCVLLTPFSKMKSKVKEAVRERVHKLRDRVLSNIPCFGQIDMKKWSRANGDLDDFDETSRKRCLLRAANKFVEKIVDGAKSKKKKGSDFIINSIRDDAALNILQGDATEEEYEAKQDSRLEALKKASALYTQDKDVKAAMKLFSKYSVVFVVIFDILLITYRNLKTYRFAFMMAAGYVIVQEHQRVGEDRENRNAHKAHKSVLQRVIHMLTRPILLFFTFFNFLFKLIFTSLIVPVLAALGVALALFYVAMSFTYNGLNMETLDQLGALTLLSSRLDVNFKLTRESLEDQAAYLNKFDLGMYKKSVHVQTQELRNTVKEFNEDEIIRIKRVEAELCDIDKQIGCTINLRKMMEKLEMNVKPCAFPVIKARMPDNIYDREAYHKQLKHELKRYVDALRNVIIRTFYIFLSIVGTVIFIKVMSKLIFKFLKSMGMIRIKRKHIYYEIPESIKKRYDKRL